MPRTRWAWEGTPASVLVPPFVLIAAAIAVTPGFATGGARAGQPGTIAGATGRALGTATATGDVAPMLKLPDTVGVVGARTRAACEVEVAALALDLTETLIEVPATVPW